jgi:hypothetical protein
MIRIVKRERGPLLVARLSLGLVALLLLGTFAGTGPAPARAAEAPNSLGLRATYDVAATLKWSKRRLNVVSTAHVRNTTTGAVSALTFNFAPAQIGQMVLKSVLAGGQPTTATRDDQNLIVDLPTPLEPDAEIDVTIAYNSTLGNHSRGKQWLYAKLNGIVTAYRWIPWLSKPYDFITPTFGEPFVTKMADEVRVSITTDRPGVALATTGRSTGVNGLTQSFVANDVRDFNFTASPRYLTRTGTWNGVSITYRYVNLNPDKLVQYTIAALNAFSELVGPYRYDELTVSESHVGYAMESPSLIWIPGNSPASNVRYLVTHEIAHQWFYGMVGNDQGGQPFADEAMAEFLTRHLIGHRASRCAEDFLDKRVWDYTKACYYESLYVQGEHYIEAYRTRVGNDNFWSGMRTYYDQYAMDPAGALGGTKKLLDTLDAAAAGAGGGHEDRFPTLFPGTGG